MTELRYAGPGATLPYLRHGPVDVGWLRRTIGETPTAPNGPTWDEAAAGLEALPAEGSPCECCETDLPGPGELADARLFLDALKASGFPAPDAVYCHCGGTVYAEWAWGDSLHATRIHAEFWRRKPGVADCLASFGDGRPCEFADVVLGGIKEQ